MPESLPDLVARLRATTPALADVPDEILTAEVARQLQARDGPSVGEAIGVPTFRTRNEKDAGGAAVVRAPESAWTKAATIGAPGIGARYPLASVGEMLASDNPLKLLAEYVTGPGRPRSVANADPTGIDAFTEGKGPMPMFMGTTEEAAQGIRGYHGSPHEFERFQLPTKTREPAVFLSSSEDEARQFGQMKTGGTTPHMYEAAIPKDALHTVDYTDYSPGGDPLYEPETMERILKDAKAQGAKAVKIQGVQNFEHGAPSDTYAILDPALITTLRKYGFLLPAAGLGYLSQVGSSGAPEAR